MSRAARIRPIPRLKTEAARNKAPTYAKFINPFGSVAEGDATERKNAVGIRIAAIGAPVRAIHFQKGGRIASSTYRSMTCAPKIVTQRVIGVSRNISCEKLQEGYSSIHHAGKNGEKYPRRHSGFS